ncbi:uncharacterized protein LOC113503192 isoform X6 [Trichoplusia ni]|uniref:Uncharacterized protein LOC113503192 isoform X6 n=1 Tax=Trichoplusia ni TaxID=7111 RepID=A0A7E5WJ77_TRINI|nr:uncharacterized protein LOC113503192 isoform X6 [Trichoplusia ni]
MEIMDLVSTIMIGVLLLMGVYLFWMWFCFGNCVKNRQKTRNPQQRRMYVGSRARPSVGQAEPSIYVSPCNLPPPPKYECMAPPSYEEVVGVHYPTFQPQPITQPITNALQSSPEPSAPSANNDTVTRINETVQRNTDETVITVPATRTVAATS